MQEASFAGFIRTLFYIITFYYIFRFLAKLFLPLLVIKVVEKAGQNMYRQQQQQQQQRQSQHSWNNTQEDETIIYNTQNVKKPRETKKVGDYVDYEELE